MVQAMHLDGLVLLAASMLLALLGRTFHCWKFRAPMFAVAFADFALGLNHLGAFRAVIDPMWFWLRMIADVGTLALIAIYLLGLAHARADQT